VTVALHAEVAVLGAGAVGLSMGAALARSGNEVTLLVRDTSRVAYPNRVTVTGPLRDAWSAPVLFTDHLDVKAGAAPELVLVAVPAHALVRALELLPDPLPASTVVVPLLNGIDHQAVLVSRYGDRVAAGAVRVEARRTAPGTVWQASLFCEVDLAASPRAERVCEILLGSGLGAVLAQDAENVLWRKLVLVAPLALATAAAGGDLAAVRRDPGLLEQLLACCAESAAVATAAGVPVDASRALRLLRALPGRVSTSLERDFAVGGATELETYAGPILGMAAVHDIPVPATTVLVEALRSRGTGVKDYCNQAHPKREAT